MNSESRETVPLLQELVDQERWQRLQNHFSRVLGLSLRTVSSSKEILSEPSWPSGIDPAKLTDLFKMGEELDQLFSSGASDSRESTIVTKPTGVSYAAVPLRATPDLIVAYLVVGPVLLGRREEQEQFRRRISAMGLDPEPLWSALLTIKLYSYSSFKSVLSFLEESSAMALELALQARQLKSIVPLAVRVDHIVAKHYTKKLWQALLDVASAATKAEGGSVMLYESAKEAYRIAAAQGLPEEVVRSAQVKMGEGISGIAAQRGQILLVDDQSEPELKTRMLRPQIVSSLVAPVSADPAYPPVGVLNLYTCNPASRFTFEDVELLRKLVQLAQTVLATLSATS